MPPRESNAISSGRSAAFTSGTGTAPSNSTAGLGRAASSTGSFIADNLLGIDDMRNAYQHAKSGNWTGVGRSALAIGAELGGTVAAAAAIGLSGGAATPGVAAIYAGKVAAKKGAKEVAEVGAQQAMKNAEKKAADSALKRAGSETIENKVVKSEAKDYKAQAKEAWDIHKRTTTYSDRKFLNKGQDEIRKMSGEKKTPPGSGKGRSRYGDVQGGSNSKLPGSGGNSPTGGSGGMGGRGPLGSEGGGSGGGIGGSGTGASGTGASGRTATLERTRTPGGRGLAPEPERLTPPKMQKPKPNPNFGRGSGTAVEREADSITKIGINQATDAIPTRPNSLPDAAGRVISSARPLNSLGNAVSNLVSPVTKPATSTPTDPAPTTTGTGSGSGGGAGGGPGGRGRKDKDLDFNIGVGRQNVTLQRIN
jgi:hypothetical protein